MCLAIIKLHYTVTSRSSEFWLLHLPGLDNFGPEAELSGHSVVGDLHDGLRGDLHPVALRVGLHGAGQEPVARVSNIWRNCNRGF